jgi:D-glycero-D-manno-heptose 1,7-bisphosphate phosphatase
LERIVSRKRRRAVLLDRDGTLNEEVHYLHRIADLRLIDGVAEAIATLNRNDWLVIVITNQAGIARGYFDRAAVDALHAHLLERLAEAGARIDAFYICPHHPNFGRPCQCRKPAPGMLLQAAVDYDLDLAQCWMIGDKDSDLGAGCAAGCRTILVRTGYGAETEGTPAAASASAIVDDVGAAVRFIMNGNQDLDAKAQRRKND